MPDPTSYYIVAADIDNWPSGYSDAQKLAVIQRVEALIETLTDDYFYAKAFVTYLNGNGSDQLFLGLTPDILSVTEIKVAGVTLTTDWWTFDTESVYLDPEAASGEADDLAELHLRLKYEESLFPEGTRNIKVTGTYGWSACPKAVKQAAIILARAENDETLYERYSDYQTDHLGDRSVSLGTTPAGNTTYLTGIMEADRWLRRYVRTKPVLGVA